MFGRDAVARTFDTPGFRGMEFYEIHARSIINKVPDASRMPFRWTINPYRGCSHSCVYCLLGETPVLMADGRIRPLAEVRVGDAIYGTARQGNYRRYVLTEVLAHWQTVRPGYRVTLADGTHLVASGDHRFLSDRGWKFVTGAGQGSFRRPHLTAGSSLMGTGGFAHQPKDSPDYRRGYLCAMIRGDGHLRRYPYDGKESCLFRLALAETEGLTRTRDYLAAAGLRTTEFTFAEAADTRRRMQAISASSRDGARVIEWLIRWPESPGTQWCKGFLAGIFDAAGSYDSGVWRVCHGDPEILGQTACSMRALGFTVVVEPARPNGVTSIRLLGGVREALRFFHTADPAITGKRSIAGAAVTSDAGLRVTRIEPLGMDLPMFDITTGTGDFIADGVVSHNCFARNTHTYLDLDAGLDFDTKVVVKVNAPELARKELARPSWTGEHVAMGTNVDCYQRAEGRYRLMPGIIEALRDARNPFSILTKGTLLLRDLDLLEEAAEVTSVGLNLSVGFTDAELSSLVEPGTPSPQRRLDACAAVTGRGLRCGILMGPVLPFLTDSPGQLEATVRAIAASGAASVSPVVLHLRPGAREWYLAWLAEHYPELAGRYRQLYRSGAYAPKDYQRKISALVAEFAARYGIGRNGAAAARRVRPRPPPRSDPRQPAPAAPAGEQLTLM